MAGMFLVTGATGKVGSNIAKQLFRQKYPVRAVTRDLQSARRILGNDVEMQFFDYKKPETYNAVLKGVSRMFLMLPDEIAGSDAIFNFINAAKNSGVERTVFLSVIGADQYEGIPHYTVENYCRDTGMETILLRPNWYMQNFSSYYHDQIAEDNRIFVPAGHGKTAFIDTRDISALAARFLEIDLTMIPGRVFTLTGPEALDHFEVAAIFSEVLGRTITYADPDPAAYVQEEKKKGISDEEIQESITIYEMVRSNAAAFLTDDIENNLGRKPVSFRQYVKDYAETWK